jgi:hypothetical protein
MILTESGCLAGDDAITWRLSRGCVSGVSGLGFPKVISERRSVSSSPCEVSVTCVRLHPKF